MKDIFVSYKKQDAERVQLLVRALERQGFSVWWDRTIPPGSTWAQVIEQAIESCRVVVVVWSKRSVESDWVHKEARKGEARRNLVPVVIDDVEIPFEFEHIQGARLVGWDGVEAHEQFEQLLSQIRERIEASPDAAQAADHAEERLRRRGAALRSLWVRRCAAAAATAVTAALVALYFLRPADSVEIRLRDLRVSGARFTLPTAGVNGGVQIASRAGSDSTILVLDELAVSNLVAWGLRSARIPAGREGAPQSFDQDPLVELRTAGPGSVINISALTLRPGARLELQQNETSHQMVISGASEALYVDLSGPIAIYVEEADTLDFSVPGRVVLNPKDDGLTLEFEPVDDGVALFENLAIADLRLYRVDQDVGLEGTNLTRVSTIEGGTLAADWLSGPRELVEGEGLSFASFDGEIQRLGLTQEGLTLNAVGRVTDLRSGLSGEGADLMPTRLAALGGVTRWLVLAGTILLLGAFGFVNLRLWRRTI